MNAVLEREAAQLSFFPVEPAPVSRPNPSEEAARAFDVALDQLAMRTYWEMPTKYRPAYRRVFIAGFTRGPLPKEAIENMDVFDSYWLGERLAFRWNGRDRFI